MCTNTSKMCVPSAANTLSCWWDLKYEENKKKRSKQHQRNEGVLTFGLLSRCPHYFLNSLTRLQHSCTRACAHICFFKIHITVLESSLREPVPGSSFKSTLCCHCCHCTIWLEIFFFKRESTLIFVRNSHQDDLATYLRGDLDGVFGTLVNEPVPHDDHTDV